MSVDLLPVLRPVRVPWNKGRMVSARNAFSCRGMSGPSWSAYATISTGKERKPSSFDPATGLGRYLGSRSHLKIRFAFNV